MSVTVGVVAFAGISPFHLSVPCMVLGESSAGFEVQVCALQPGYVPTSAGFGLHIERGLEVLDTAELVIIPSWTIPHQTPPPALLTAVQAAYQRGAQVVGLCLGAYVLAEAGLLDGRCATTHWAFAHDFAQRFPQVQLQPQVLYVQQHNLLTSAGTAAGLDCCLHLLRQRYGARIANRTARRLVAAPHRQGGQAQFIEQPLPKAAHGSRLAELIDWVRANLAHPHSLDSLAARALMSRRSFTRHFQLLTGTKVSAWLVRERLAYSQRLLESSDLSIEQIAARAGFGSSAALRQHFQRAFAVTPSAWRQTFGGNEAQ